MSGIRSIRIVLGAAALSFMATGVNAAVVITATENGGGVDFTLESGGSLDISGLLYGFSTDTDDMFGATYQGGIVNSTTSSLIGGEGAYTIWQGVSGPEFGSGTGGVHHADSYSSAEAGTVFGFGGDELWIDSAYSSGDLISSWSMSFSGESFSSMGLSEGNYVYTLLGSGDTITLNVVPIPAAVWLFGSALAGLGWARRKQVA